MGGESPARAFEIYRIEEQHTLSPSTVLPKTLLSAAEIVELRLPGLPTTKANVLARAEKERWRFEEATGLGGVRKVFEVPERYLAGIERPSAASSRASSKRDGELLQKAADYVKQAREHGGMTDAELIQEIVVGVERWLARNKLHPDVEKKAALISLLFRYFQSDGALDEAKMDKLLKAVA